MANILKSGLVRVFYKPTMDIALLSRMCPRNYFQTETTEWSLGSKLTGDSFEEVLGYSFRVVPSVAPAMLIADMEASGNNVALVMSYSGLKRSSQFKIYLHAPTQGCTAQRIESRWPILGLFCGNEGNSGNIGNC